MKMTKCHPFLFTIRDAIIMLEDKIKAGNFDEYELRFRKGELGRLKLLFLKTQTAFFKNRVKVGSVVRLFHGTNAINITEVKDNMLKGFMGGGGKENDTIEVGWFRFLDVEEVVWYGDGD